MCGRFTIITPIEKLIEQFEADLLEEDLKGTLFPNYNAAPGQKLLVITNTAPRQISLYRWGLIPYWAKDPAIGYKLINARSETITEKSAFKNAFKKRRCIILADSYFEWEKKGAKKIPYRILMKNDKPFAMAGIWETWKNTEGKEVYSFSIITTEANSLTKDIHDRMPCILDKKKIKMWLDTNIPEPAALQLLKPYPNAEMKLYEVSTLVNSPKNNSPQIIEPVK
ncbi:MAG: SOS response-associated peptidase [Ignavibacteria bacterium]|jgi:putative SOS response-associated peptidase YedK